MFAFWCFNDVLLSFLRLICSSAFLSLGWVSKKNLKKSDTIIYPRHKFTELSIFSLLDRISTPQISHNFLYQFQSVISFHPLPTWTPWYCRSKWIRESLIICNEAFHTGQDTCNYWKTPLSVSFQNFTKRVKCKNNA